MAQALRITSNRNTASGDAPSGTTTTIFHSIESPISTGWKRTAVVTSMSRSA